MRILLLLSAAVLLFCSCNNKAKGPKTFCDTTCKSDSLVFNGDPVNQQSVVITISGCRADNLSWSHRKSGRTATISLTDFLNREVRLNRSALSVAFQDTTLVWITFNDCLTGRGYLLKLPYRKSATKPYQRIIGALNNFDPKFKVDDDLRAYTDKGNLFVDNVKTGQSVTMTFKQEYPIDFNYIHDVIDSINVSKTRVFARLIKDGQNVDFEKKIEL